MQRNEFRKALGLAAASAGVAGALLAFAPARVEACGGFFCSSANPVNQAAEQIIFSQNGDGTVTEVIQIMYEGPSQKFAWVLPVPGKPKVGVSSDPAFARLKQATNPLYQLTTTFDGMCSVPQAGFANSGPIGTMAPSAGVARDAVTVVASGAIGPYDYDVISVDPKQSDQAQVAVDWLMLHGFDVGPMGATVLRPYLADGLNLIAFKLSKGSSTGSIRPIMLTITSDLPSIPIRPTAVAANDDMGVMVWLLSDARGIPQNYKALELNEALIDWFNPNNNYNKVVSKAADEANGQGFVTEYAQTTSTLMTQGVTLFSPSDQQLWDQFQAATHTDALSMIRDASANWGGWDGFDDALAASVMLPSTIALSDFKNCVACYISAPGVSFDTTTFLTKLYEMVIKPMADTQTLLSSRPFITRLYTTMSAAEMTLDPVFDFNPELPVVSNVHTAKRIVSCSGTTGFGNGPWRVELPQGDVVYGTMPNVWPISIDDTKQPAALKILEYGKTGQGKVLDDQSGNVTKLLKEQNGSMGGSGGSSSSSGGSGGSSSSGTAGSVGSKGSGGNSSSTTGTAGAGMQYGEAGAGGSGSTTTTKHSGGCSVASGRPADGATLLGLALCALFTRTRRRRA